MGNGGPVTRAGKLVRLLRNLLAAFGVLCLVVGAYAAWRIARDRGLTPRAFAVKVAQKAGVQAPWVEDLFRPRARYGKRELLGAVKSAHPRVLWSSNAEVAQLRSRYRDDTAYRSWVDDVGRNGSYSQKAVAWFVGRDAARGLEAVEALLRAAVAPPQAEELPGNLLDLALAYDLVYDHPAWGATERASFEAKLRGGLKDLLEVLDGDGASLWHGRIPMAGAAWASAVVLGADDPEGRRLLVNAQYHFLDALSGLELSEGWPEGYTYWINLRAYEIVLGCIALSNGLDHPELSRRAQRMLLRLGLWTVHGTEPTGRFALFGEPGPRNDLAETGRIADLIGLSTGLPVFREYSRHVWGLHKGGAYQAPHRWAIPLFRGLPRLDFRPDEALRDLSILNGRLPTSELFGREGLGQVFLRSDWGPDATFVSFQAGSSLTHHGHYQAGHFTITKKAPLAITSGTYGGWTEPHRLNYYLRTVAANSLLVLRPGEKVKPNRFFEENVADGGQRITMPTGSSVGSVQDWRDNLHKGKHYEGGQIAAFENADPRFVYVGSDLTDAYNNTAYDDNGDGGKVSRVTRQLVYLRGEDLVLVHDRVAATDGSYAKKWLLHSWGRPETSRERVLAGTREDGILETPDARATVRHGGGELSVLRLLPEDAVIRKVGGPHHRYYVETDGDDSDLDGTNMTAGADERPWFDAGLWRIEIQPPPGRKEDHFLVVMKPSLEGQGAPPQATLLKSGGCEGAVTPKTVVVFGKEGVLERRVTYSVPGGGQRLHIVVDAPRDRPATVAIGSEIRQMRTTREGVLAFSGTGAAVTVDFGN
jgi:hypothetical protein